MTVEKKKCIDCGSSEIYAEGIYCNSCKRFVGRRNEQTCVLADSVKGRSNVEIVDSLRSLYPLKDFEEEAIIEVVAGFRELKEKATAKKAIPLDKNGEYHECPTCGCGAENYLGCSYRYCPNCGTEFDWSEGKE